MEISPVEDDVNRQRHAQLSHPSGDRKLAVVGGDPGQAVGRVEPDAPQVLGRNVANYAIANYFQPVGH